MTESGRNMLDSFKWLNGSQIEMDGAIRSLGTSDEKG